jgi:hypothetical protein
LSGRWKDEFDVFQNFTDIFDKKIDRKLTAKKRNLTRSSKKNLQRKSLKALVLLVGREGIEPSTY